MANTQLLILIKKNKNKNKKEKEKITIDYMPKWRRIKKKQYKITPLLIPAAAVASRPFLSPPLITEPFSRPKPDKLLRLNPLQRRKKRALLFLLFLLLLLLLLLGDKRERN